MTTIRLLCVFLSLQFLASVSLSQGQLPQWDCKYTAPDGSSFDFSRLATDGGTEISISGGVPNSFFILNVCGVIAPNYGCNNTAAMLCLDQFNEASPLAYYGMGAAPVFSTLDPAGSSKRGVRMLLSNLQTNNTVPIVELHLLCGQPTNYMDVLLQNSYYLFQVIDDGACALFDDLQEMTDSPSANKIRLQE